MAQSNDDGLNMRLMTKQESVMGDYHPVPMTPIVNVDERNFPGETDGGRSEGFGRNKSYGQLTEIEKEARVLVIYTGEYHKLLKVVFRSKISGIFSRWHDWNDAERKKW
jgi:hypothetical protein